MFLLIIVALSVSLYPAVTLAYQQFLIVGTNEYELGTYLVAAEHLATWFCAAIVAVIALMPDFLFKVFRKARRDAKIYRENTYAFPVYY
jgi:hypothetical protein